MAYIISSGESSNGIILNNDSMTVLNGGIQFVPDMKAVPTQIIYLDFDGELTRYRNADLNIGIDEVQIEDSRLTPERIAGIVSTLNTQFAGQNVLFTASRPKDTMYSTIFVGRTTAFDQYGRFAGLAETVDLGNQIKNDNAFVLLNASNSDSDIVSTIAHEVEHLIGILDHGGEGLVRYADNEEDKKTPGYIYYYKTNNHTLTGNLDSSVSLAHYESSRTIVSSRYQSDGGDSYVSIGKNYVKANGTTINSNGSMYVYSGGTANSTTVNDGGYLRINPGGTANYTTVNAGSLWVSTGDGTANYTTVNDGGYFCVFPSGTVNSTTINSGGCLEVLSGWWSGGGTANNITVNSGGLLLVPVGTAVNVIENGGYVKEGESAIVSFLANTINGLLLSGRQSASLHSGTVAIQAEVLGGYLRVCGGIANNTFISSGNIGIYSGGIANSISAEGGEISIVGGSANYIAMSGGSLSIGSGGVTNSVTITPSQTGKGGFSVGSEGKANNTIVYAGGTMFVGGVANNTTVYSGGIISIGQGGVANSITVNSCAYLYVGGKGTATAVRENGGYVSVGFIRSLSRPQKLYGSVTFLSNSFSGLIISSETSATVHSGTTALSTTVMGELYIYSGGTANNTEINSAGDIYVDSGGTANYTMVNASGLLYVSSGGTAIETMVNASGRFHVYSGGTANRTMVNPSGWLNVYSGGTATIVFNPFGYGSIASSSGAVVTYLERDKDVYYGNAASGVISSADAMTGLDIESGLSAVVYENGSAKSITIEKGGYAYIFSGGRIEQSFNIEGNLTIYGGGVARIWSASTVTGESASLINSGTIEFLVASAAVGGEVLLNDYTKVSGSGGYTITINGDQQSGEYRLIGNAAAFNRNITIKAEDSEETGTFQRNGSGYNMVTLDGRDYTLKLDETNTLVLTAGMSPTNVEFEFKEVGQTVYYNGEAPDGSTLEGVLKMIPYTADITVSFDKSLTEGLYEFTTSVAEVEGSVNHFQIQVAEGIPGSDGEPAPKSVSYISDNMCYNGTLVSETDSTVTYKFTGVNDYLLIDSIPSDTMQLDVVCGTNDATVSKSKNGSFSFIHGSGLTDMNKDLCLKLINIHGATNKGESISIEVYTAGTQQNQIKNDEKNQYVLIPFVTIDGERYQDLEYELEMFEKGKRFRLCIDEKENTNNNPVFNITIDGTVDENSDVSVSQAVYNDDTITIETQNGVAGSAPRDAGYCWVATAVNMMYEAGYLDVSEKDLDKVYTIIRDNYYIRDGNQSLGADVTRVFNDYLYKKLNINTHQQGICKSFWGDAITQALQDIMSSENHTVVGGLSVSGMWDTRNINHVFTCYDVRLTMAGETLGGSVDCADSDIGFFSSLLNTWSIYYDHGIFQKNRWKMNYQNKGYITITDIVTLISNSSRNKDGKLVQLSLKDINSYKEVIISRDNYVQENTRIIYALEYEGLSDGSVSGYIFDSVIPKGSRLRVVSGAYAEEMIIHEAGSVEFDSGSIAKGTIRTTGGTLMVESGVDVSEAEFDFAVSHVENGNSSPLLNNMHNVSGSKLTITIVNGQSAGRYVLAGGASDFDGTLSVVGEYDYTQDIGEGFDNGLIGELGLENTLNIEDKNYSLSVEDDTLVLSIAVDEAFSTVPVNLVGTADGVSWEYPTGADLYEVNLSTDDFGQVFRWLTDTTAQDLYELPGGTYQWRVMVFDDGEDWAVG
ncbi:MAG: AIDA repeat-containing protein, partial [Lentisphaeria bacterium]|nr:AIDA repeat-containing protein [Lentisphaeria bacterium]